MEELSPVPLRPRNFLVSISFCPVLAKMLILCSPWETILVPNANVASVNIFLSRTIRSMNVSPSEGFGGGWGETVVIAVIWEKGYVYI